jgi:hypothetical protein
VVDARVEVGVLDALSVVTILGMCVASAVVAWFGVYTPRSGRRHHASEFAKPDDPPPHDHVYMPCIRIHIIRAARSWHRHGQSRLMQCVWCLHCTQETEVEWGEWTGQVPGHYDCLPVRMRGNVHCYIVPA